MPPLRTLSTFYRLLLPFVLAIGLLPLFQVEGNTTPTLSCRLSPAEPVVAQPSTLQLWLSNVNGIQLVEISLTITRDSVDLLDPYLESPFSSADLVAQSVTHTEVTPERISLRLEAYEPEVAITIDEGMLATAPLQTRNTPVTEAGIASDLEGRDDTGDSPYKIQSEHLVASFVQAKAANIASMIWWTLFDELPYRMGLIEVVEGQLVKKEAFGVYQVAVDQLADAVFERNLTPDAGYPLRVEPIWLGYNDLSQYLQEPFTLEAYQFYHPGKGKMIYVAWVNSLLGKPLERTFTIRANQAVVRNIYGNVVTTLNDTDSDGQIQVAVDREPIYIEVTENRSYLYLPDIGR